MNLIFFQFVVFFAVTEGSVIALEQLSNVNSEPQLASAGVQSLFGPLLEELGVTIILRDRFC